jgi:triosephosphate isomerase
MSNSIRPLIAGNWKMNGLARESAAELEDLIARTQQAGEVSCDILICPPATLLRELAVLTRNSVISLGGQDCHSLDHGAHTGDISATMLKDAGAAFCLAGHSERRTDHGETDAVVRSKAEAAIRNDLVAIVCVGETLAEREEGKTLTVVSRQVAGSLPHGASAVNTVIAYEPVWAIGTGKTPTPDDVTAVHDHIRRELQGLMADADAVRLLYGGSVKGSNAGQLMAIDNVNGALVGGASLSAADFWPIIETGL